MKNLAKAMIGVMQDVKHIAKDTTVGEGRFAYKGVSDAQVKEAFQQAFIKHELVIIPIDLDEETAVDRWMDGTKAKQSVFTKVMTKYELIHSSGESKILAGYGHGVDTQDKGAGKATTYALKNVLLNTFLVPTSNDDTDSTHSNNIETPAVDNRQWLNAGSAEWTEAIKYLNNGGTIEKIKSKYKINKRDQDKLLNESIS